MSPRDADVARPDASVIVVTHNNAPLIADCLRAIRAGVGSRSHEVILVDNGNGALLEHGKRLFKSFGFWMTRNSREFSLMNSATSRTATS